jgi:excisionase family DNA binding protein
MDRQADKTERLLTTAEVAERLAVNQTKVQGWIKSGELRAMDLAQKKGSRRPRYKITPTALAEFEASRAVGPPMAVLKRRRPVAAGVKRFF